MITDHNLHLCIRRLFHNRGLEQFFLPFLSNCLICDLGSTLFYPTTFTTCEAAEVGPTMSVQGQSVVLDRLSMVWTSVNQVHGLDSGNLFCLLITGIKQAHKLKRERSERTKNITQKSLV